MKKLGFIFSIALICCLISSCGTRIQLYSRDEFLQQVNLIENSGFEMLDDLGSELPEGWILLNNDSRQVLIDSQVAHTGNKSLKIKKPDADLQLTSDSFSVDPTCSYYCRCFIRSDKTTDEPVILYFFTFDQSSKRINRFAKRVYPSLEWNMVEITANDLAAGSAFGRIVLSIPQDSAINIWIDDVESYNICSNK